MRQFFWLTRGSAGFEVEGDKQVKNLHTLDAACIAEGQRHYAPRFSADFRVLQMSMPAEYDTFETDRPQ